MAAKTPEGAAGSSAPFYTPGPWSIADHGGRLLIDSAKHFVATVPFCDATAMADASLIAAAPDLLTTLRDLVKGFAGTEFESVFDDAKAVIAKAEGRA